MKTLKNQENTIRELTSTEISAVSGGEDIIIIDTRNISEKLLTQICIIIIIFNC